MFSLFSRYSLITSLLFAAFDAASARADNSVVLNASHPREIPPVGKNSWGGVNRNGDRISVTSQTVELNGKPFIIVAGEMHPTRTSDAAWEESIMKMKAAGLNTVSCYILWNHIEQDPGQFDFTGNRDIRRFVELCAKHGMYVWLRAGPFSNSEALGGGLPLWIFGEPVLERSNDPGYLFYVERLYKEIGRQLHGQMFKDGGPVIAIQLENEYGEATPTWDFPFPGAGPGNAGVAADGVSHMMKLKELALKAGLDAPLFTATAWGHGPVPTGEFLETWGCYGYLGSQAPTNTSTFIYQGRKYAVNSYPYPVAFCELGGGAPVSSGWRPTIPPEGVEVGLFTRVACGANITGMYMFVGGSNPSGKHGTLNKNAGWPIISYDFLAPIGEYGRIKPSYYQLRPMQLFLRDFPDLLAPTVTVWPDKYVEPTDTQDLRYIARVNGDSGFLFLNNFQDKLVLPDRTDVRVTIQLKDETITIPDDGPGLTLKSGVMAILPFNLPLEGAKLKFATAQLMTKVDVKGTTVFVFLAPKGMAAEYAFDSATVARVQGLPTTISGNVVRVPVLGPGTGAVFNVTPKSGKTFFVLTLTREQAEHCLKGQDLWGAQRLILSDDDLLAESESLRVSSVGRPRLSFAVYPAPASPPKSSSGILTGTADGIFTRYALDLSAHTIHADVRKIGNDKLVVKIAGAEFTGINDIFLRVSYDGDRGWAFLNGTLIADNNNQGVPWELGLKRWKAAGLSTDGLFLRIAPWRGDSSKILFNGITFKSVDNATRPATFGPVELVPEYAADIQMK